ncbi:MAG: ribosome recycling factor [Candidatus Magasanikbacteria bacterium CG10_big_fil_rev_8_21_14_0_10_36_32]|uniref:Ribosome-recycling factor n=1 Tax=Candidatus Magasanikbacteria bacterium CG10_big_fil_rev_8_21_14_0_10_36_32 TaxID=1974646 RepID=A0A2M6W5Y0_9BACT|nr:MAG: ribosome recycling factor [Candidatus Magasanikbacteria bacterium CG10_big_fil_rev_8_21_14_0_10_36_32]
MNINDFKVEFNKTIDFLKTEVSGLRTGRASAAIVETVLVEAYGTRQSLKAAASITVADSKTLNIEPWDKSLLGAIEKGIRDSGLGLNPVNDGRMIRLFLPELTVERRQELIKVLHQKLENARISIRKIREEVRDLILAAEESNEISEDERFRLQEELDKVVKDFNEKIKDMGERKEEEINTI